MVFCNNKSKLIVSLLIKSHNPYFNRWFSAIYYACIDGVEIYGHNPYFNRWFSAMIIKTKKYVDLKSHNPYFNRWFSAIKTNKFLANVE